MARDTWFETVARSTFNPSGIRDTATSAIPAFKTNS